MSSFSSSSRGRVTITLGRSGQVVKRTGSISDVTHADYEPSAGSKRPIRERLGNTEDSRSSSSPSRIKRQRKEDHMSRRDDDLVGNQEYLHDCRVGRDDLRYKLLRKSMSKRSYSSGPDERNGDLREKLSRNDHCVLRIDAHRHVPESRASCLVRQIPSTRSESRGSGLVRQIPSTTSESRASGLVRQIPSTRSAEDLCHLNSSRKSYSYASDGPRHRSPDRLLGASRGKSPPRFYGDLYRVPSSMRSVDISRPTNLIPKSSTNVPRPEPLVRRTPHPAEVANPVMRAPMPEEPHTVAGLLHSLGLGKYAIIFQAEEVDMAALKQMGDHDLKELGIPMGPRKKILLAVLPRLKQRHP